MNGYYITITHLHLAQLKHVKLPSWPFAIFFKNDLTLTRCCTFITTYLKGHAKNGE